MSNQQEDAAKWGVVESYRVTKAKLSALKNRLYEWGKSYSEFGSALINQPDNIDISSLSSLPEREELKAALTELKETESEHIANSERLRGLGLEPF